MAFAPQQQQKQGILQRFLGLIILMAILLITAVLFAVGYVLNTVFDANLPVASLPAQAQAAFAAQVSYTLTTYGLGIIAIIVIAIAGTLAAVFGLQSRVEDTEEF